MEMERYIFGETVIEKLCFGILYTNCYVISSNEQVVVVDPSCLYDNEKQELADGVNSSGQLKYIINTHGHFDHISGNSFLKSLWKDSLIGIEANDAKRLLDPSLNLSAHTTLRVISDPGDVILKDGDIIKVGDLRLKVIHTPGHTKGSICLLGEGFVLTGDTLFEGTVGSAKEYKGAFDELVTSIKTRLMVLPDNTMVFPGHGENSTIGEEREYNPFLCDGR